ncbi:uncharacterized protein LOC129908896 [Episyrphus balteatus]|uniref:uncharacterized protein LOC129908896 n=1 Tax=Episyrphus balteatus TaxID=286459 RepID=UPI00248696CB|nr:uncharacterized protein LOC129908896 [Episyrphus balteatus]
MCTEEDETEKVSYQEAVGCLLYLVQGSRPDIAFAVNDVSRFNAKHGKANWTAVKRIFRYLKDTINLKLHFKGAETLNGFSDADWASDIDKRRSCTGFAFNPRGGAISWRSKRQPTVALFSTEVEYMAAVVQEATWLKQFGAEIDECFKKEHILIACDNQSAIKLAETNCFRSRSKHIEVWHHHIRDRINDGTIAVRYISTEEMAADNLTKAVPSNKHQLCLNKMGLNIKN